MTPKLFDDWIAALRSGKYKQGRGRLRGFNDCYCCLGVLADIINTEVWTKDSTGRTCYAWHKGDVDRLDIMDGGYRILSNAMQDILIEINDDEEGNFNYIADYLESIRDQLMVEETSAG